MEINLILRIIQGVFLGIAIFFFAKMIVDDKKRRARWQRFEIDNFQIGVQQTALPSLEEELESIRNMRELHGTLRQHEPERYINRLIRMEQERQERELQRREKRFKIVKKVKGRIVYMRYKLSRWIYPEL